jgi:hypothetical protein
MSPFSRACLNRLGDAGSVFSALLASAIACSGPFQRWIMQDVAVELYDKKNGKVAVFRRAAVTDCQVNATAVTNGELEQCFSCYNMRATKISPQVSHPSNKRIKE